MNSLLTSKIKTIPISDKIERKKIVIAANNGGEGLIAMAQIEALNAGKNPALWSNINEFLVKAGASESKTKEIMEYVNKILEYEEMFKKDSKADKSDKFKEPLKNYIHKNTNKWITKDGKHIHI